MPQWHEKFIMAVMIVAMVTLPCLSYASVAEKLANAGFSLGSSIDKSVSFAVALPPRTIHALATTIDRASQSVMTAAEDIIKNVKAQISNAKSVTEIQRTKLQTKTQNLASSFTAQAERQYSMLRRILTISQNSGTRLMSGAKDAIKTVVLRSSSFALQATKDTSKSVAGTARNILSSLSLRPLLSFPRNVKEGAASLSLSLRGSESDRGNPDENNGIASSVALLLPRNDDESKRSDDKNLSPLRIIERIIEKVVVKESSNDKAQMPNQIQNPNDQNSNMQDPRINTLITNVADLTSRIDGGNAGGSPTPSNTALFNMISQFQRIKTLDDVKITNATIEGYVTGTTLSNYLPLGGGTLTGGLTGTSLTLSNILNASSTTHFTATSTFGNLIRIEGTGTSTILGRLSISATSTMAGYKICTQENNVCAGGAFSSSGGLTTLRTATDLVGIGTSTPAEKLSINGGAFFDSDIIRFGSSSQPTLNFRYFASSTSTIPNLTSAFTYATSTTNTPLFTLSTKSSRYGRIGIGTSTPSALFAINALNASNQADNLFYIGSSTQNTFVIDNHGNLGIGTSSPRSRLTIEGGLGAYFTSSGLLALGTTTPWKSSTLSIEQNGVNPLLTLGDTGTTTPFLMVTGKGIVSFGSTSPILLNPSDLVIGRNGVTNDAYISGGLGIGNATTTDGLLELSGIAYIGNVLKVKGTSTSTFAGPVELTATSTLLGSKLCTAKNGICTRTIRKTSDETVNNSTTLQNDDELFLPMAANETWYFRARLAYNTATTPQINFAFTVPAGAVISWEFADAGVTTINTSGGTNNSGGGGGKSATIFGIAINGGTAGNLQLQWAQSTLEASNTKVLTNSYLEAHK